MPDDNGTVTDYLCRLKDGDRAGVRKLWESYFPRLVKLARGKLRGTPRKLADEEDVALHAFDSFCRAAEAGRFPRLDDREDLWQVLVTVTLRKAIDLIDYQARARRDWRLETPQANMPAGDISGEGSAIVNLIHDPEPDPRFAAELADQFEELLRGLADEELRRIAVMKMEGYANQEIADDIGKALPTVERRLRRIRNLWKKELPEPPTGGEG